MSIYNWLTNGKHIITIRNRETNRARQVRYWNGKIIDKVLSEQKPSEDVYITKYPSTCLVSTIILDFDSDEDISLAFKDVKRMRNYLAREGHNCVIVESGSKGYHLYVQIAPFLFKDTDMRKINDWMSFFNAFVCFLIHDGKRTEYPTLDAVNFSAGLNGNIRLINSTHPKTQNKCRIIDGEFVEYQIPTEVQDSAQRVAYQKVKVIEEDKKNIIKKTRVEGNDPIESNDLREVFRSIVGDIKLYPRGYAYCRCPEHGDNNPSLLVTKNWFSCSADCGFKGNVFTLKKMGYVTFDDRGRVKF